MLDYGYGDYFERAQAERADEHAERSDHVLHGRCFNCGGSAVRCCEFGADRVPTSFSEGTAGGLDLHGSFFNDRSPSSPAGGRLAEHPLPARPAGENGTGSPGPVVDLHDPAPGGTDGAGSAGLLHEPKEVA